MVTRRSKILFAFGLDAWSTAYGVALAIAAFGAVAVLLTSLVVINLQKQESDAQKVMIATLQKEAAIARLEQARLERDASWRSLSELRIDADLEKALATHPGSVNIRYTHNDAEARALAVEFETVFRKAKWRVAIAAFTPIPVGFSGIWLPDRTGADAMALKAAFKHVGIPVGMSQVRGHVIDGTTIDGAPTLFVGEREPQ